MIAFEYDFSKYIQVISINDNTDFFSRMPKNCKDIARTFPYNVLANLVVRCEISEDIARKSPRNILAISGLDDYIFTMLTSIWRGDSDHMVRKYVLVISL